MTGGKYPTVKAWLDECRARQARSLDNVILVTGPEGEGKSTVAYQIARALDSSYGPGRYAFGIRSFLRIAIHAPPGVSVSMDEAELDATNVMDRDVRALMEFLKRCRYRRLNVLICFPHLDLFLKRLANHRVRWQVHVPERGTFLVLERQKRVRFLPGGREQVFYKWVEVGRFKFGPNSGPAWETYEADKDRETMRDLQALLEDDEPAAEPAGSYLDREGVVSVLKATAPWEDASDLDRAAVVEYLSGLRSNGDGAGPRAAIRGRVP